MINIGALKDITAGVRGLWLPPFLVCGGEINLEVRPVFIGICLAHPDLTVVVKHTCLEDELIALGEDFRWQVGRIASCCIFYSSFHLVD